MDLTHKKIMVTGGAGFLGSYVVDELHKNGCREVFVPTIDKYDLVDKDSVRRAYDDAQPDIVIHLAAKVGGIGANQKMPGSFFYDNLMMGAQLMEEARHRAVEKFVALGTICCYPKFTPTPFREEHLWDGYPEETNAPYGLAKKMLLVQSQAYRQQYNFNSIFLMPVNLYGPGDSFDLQNSHVIPALIRKFMEAKLARQDEVTVWGSGNATREFLFVKDCAKAIVAAMTLYNEPEPINIGSGYEISIHNLATLIAELVGFSGTIVWDALKPDGQPRRLLAVDKAREKFGFVAETNFREGLQQTINWYRDTLGVSKVGQTQERLAV